MSPLADRTYRRLFAAQVIALLGTGLSSIALALLAYDLATGDAGAVLGTALALKMVAYVGIAPIVGGFAHRLARKRLLIGLDEARAGLAACLPFVTEVWKIYLLLFLLNGCSAGFTPTFQTTIPDVLPDEGRYTRALSLSRRAYDLENLLSPTLAAAALLFISYNGLFAANAAVFAVSAKTAKTGSETYFEKPGLKTGRTHTFSGISQLLHESTKGSLAPISTEKAGYNLRNYEG